MKFPKHEQGPSCRGCDERIMQAHDTIAEFFYFVKARDPSAHCSWVHRGKEDQEKAFKERKSMARFGQSKHNLLPAEAIDLFQINEEGRAVFDPIWCAKINKAAIEAGYELRWGGHFKKLGDAGHFETT